MGENGKERIGDYELEALIGDGAQGRVYRARCVSESLPHVKMGEAVALKVVRITGEDEKLRRKFQEQAEILRRLSHTNIVSYRDCFAWHAGEWDESQCLVMELLEGESLGDRLKKANTGLPWPQVEEIFEQCLAGLIHARERGVTHRDIKPSNIFITRDGQAKLIDFDIARRDDGGQMSTAGWKGTFDYMAPDFISVEAFRGDEQSDIFSLGVCFYQALTGSLPFEPLGETAHIGYLNRWRNSAAQTPSFRPGVFRVLSNAKALVVKSLAVKREERYATFSAMLEEFRKIRYRRIRHKNKDEYELLAVLGRGGFGEVFKARRVSDGMLVAVKYLFSEKQSDRFVKEAKILQQYPHPNLVKYVDFLMLEGTAGEKQFFLIMEFLEGMPGWTLRHRIKNEGKLEVSEAVPLFGSYLSALQFLHGSARPIVHRDIKPGNLYAPMGQPDKGKIFDLGVARDVSGTVTVGGVPGTLDYMAPEFAETGKDRGSPQSDLYALALCLYEALAGKPVFGRLPTDLNSAWLAFQDRIRKPPAIAFDADAFAQYPRLQQVVLRALAERPESRYTSAAEMRVALEDAIKPETELTGHGDSFDMGEATMATFTGGSAGAAESGATQGTRPLEAAGATVSGPVDLIAAGRQEAGRRKKRKWLLAAAGAAAGVTILGAGVGVLAGRHGAGREGSPEDVLAVPKESSHGQAAAAGGSQKARERPAAVVPPERDPVYLGLKSEIPEKVANDADWKAAETAASLLATQEKQPWEGLDEAEKKRRLASLRTLLADLASAHVERVRDAALAAYSEGKDGREDRARMMQMATETPHLKALVAAKLDDAVTRVEAARADFAISETLAALPARIAQAPDTAAVQSLAVSFVKLEGTSGVKLRPEQVRAVEKALTEKFFSIGSAYAKQALANYEAARVTEGGESQKLLSDVASVAAPRFGKDALVKLQGEVEAQKLVAEKKALQALTERSTRQAAALRSLDDLVTRVQNGVLADCADGVSVLAGFPAEMLADAHNKAQWTAVRDAYAGLIGKALKQAEPAEGRAQRLKVAGEIVGHASAGGVFGADLTALRQSLDAQKSLGLLRLVNGAKCELQITAPEIHEVLRLAAGETKAITLPVKDESLSLSLAVGGGAKFQPRIDSVVLPKGGGVEKTIAPLEAVAVVPVAPPASATNVPPSPAAPAVNAPVAAPATPAQAVPPAVKPPADVPAPGVNVAGSATPAAKAPVAPGGASLDISVSPKAATVTVDGKPVELGRLEVAPNENHKVVVECAGYKTVQQYYKVKPNEVRKIDILLEKEAKKSLFGL